MAVIDPAQPARLNRLRSVFYGSLGLRTGWRVLAFLIPMVVFEIEGGHLLKMQHDLFGEGDTAAGWLFLKTILFIWVLVVVLIIGAFERRSLAEYGLPLRNILGKDFWAGAVWGFGLLTANIALMALTGAYSFGTVALPGVQIVKYGLLWAAADLMVGLSEEFVFRGYLLSTLARGMGFWPAAVLTSALFGLTHLDVPGEPWTAITNIALLSLFLCLALRRTGSLWFAIGSHMAFDWGQAFFYSTDRTPVQGHLFHASLHGSKWLTGGDAGPEGNVFNVFLVAVGLLLFSRIYPHVKYPVVVAETHARA